MGVGVNNNLIPFNERPESEQREIRVRGGKASGEARRRKKNLAELTHAMMGKPLSEKHREQLIRDNPLMEDEDATMAAAAVSTQLSFALRGKDEHGHHICTPNESIKAFRILQELDMRAETADKKKERFSINALDMTVDCLPAYRAVHQFFDGTVDIDDMVFKGGRGGAKSSFAALLAYETMEQDENANVVYGRRFASDLRATVFTSFVRVLNEKGVADEWDITKSPMRCTKKSTGQICYFFGFENAEQLKSFTPETGYVKLLIFEEADEMLGDEQMDSAADTFLRSNGFEGAKQLRLKVYNPPASKNNFMNEWVSAHVGDPRIRIFDFNYLNVPTEWLGDVFIERAERAKRERPEWYRNNYMGEVTGEGGELFTNVEEREITDDELRRWEQSGHVRQGLDFGYEHPMVYVKCAWDDENRSVVILGEHYERKATLEGFLANVQEEADKDERGRFYYEPRQFETICDSAEPDRIAGMRELDWDATAAVKRWGHSRGRDYSWDWLRQRSKIVIDPSRCPNLAKELRTLSFEKLRDGSYSSRYPDKDEDGVMALLYSLNRDIRAEE